MHDIDHTSFIERFCPDSATFLSCAFPILIFSREILLLLGGVTTAKCLLGCRTANHCQLFSNNPSAIYLGCQPAAIENSHQKSPLQNIQSQNTNISSAVAVKEFIHLIQVALIIITMVVVALIEKNRIVTRPMECLICHRNDFKTERALGNHIKNPGTAHKPRTSPCECDLEHLQVTKAYRVAKDRFIYKVEMRCGKCGRYPITVPLGADKAMANGRGSLEDSFASLAVRP